MIYRMYRVEIACYQPWWIRLALLFCKPQKDKYNHSFKVLNRTVYMIEDK